jgi:hypothetical protein
LGRGVFSGGQAKRWRRGSEGGDRNTFIGGEKDPSLSVDRLGYASDEHMTAIGDRIANKRRREVSRTFYGWAVVTVEHASNKGRSVRASPQDDNPYHADVDLHLPEGAERREAQIEHAVDLAAGAVWKERFRPE